MQQLNITLNGQQFEQVMNALGQQPFMQVAGLINELLRQAQAQSPEPPAVSNGAHSSSLAVGAAGTQ
jgi:hypothetical protein